MEVKIYRKHRTVTYVISVDWHHRVNHDSVELRPPISCPMNHLYYIISSMQ